MKIQTAFAFAFTTLTCGLALADQAAPDCKMQSFHSVSTAMERDRGKAREDTRVAKNASGKLTAAEIKIILDRVYISRKSETPRQIGQVVFSDCQNGQ
ncbi:hypothetical protein LPB72_11125 [Hydrogenophaga crassostreae]|uniref:EF-hand domain-containing protein n=1 Tax=Hydrogenophaga crassostreae TaxID=1763535 RepID=A0A167HWW3_9BURK|nr:hypothetical protein [Hydrogenophaga crassostreae]AOW13550.1 hypothetical protein LPB072_12505 [Hydrogenophaga crassostreae]OAD41843.1 hypothetical protein LPB72_11125 [Hydrogenophaga crassostreae]